MTRSLTVVTGLVHPLMAADSGQTSTIGLLWFVGSGVAVLLIAAITLLSTSQRSWTALAATACGADLAGLIRGAWFGFTTSWHAPEGPLSSVLFAAGVADPLLGASVQRSAA